MQMVSGFVTIYIIYAVPVEKMYMRNIRIVCITLNIYYPGPGCRKA